MRRGRRPGSATTMMARVISKTLRGSKRVTLAQLIIERSEDGPSARSPPEGPSLAWRSQYLQTRLGWPVPTLRVMKRTIVVAMVSAPKTNVRARPLEDLRTPRISSASGSA